MSDAEAAARTLAKARWKTAKLDRLIAELTERVDELEPQHTRELEGLVAKSLTARTEGGAR